MANFPGLCLFAGLKTRRGSLPDGGSFTGVGSFAVGGVLGSIHVYSHAEVCDSSESEGVEMS